MQALNWAHVLLPSPRLQHALALHSVLYDDGDEEWVDLGTEQHKLLPPGSKPAFSKCANRLPHTHSLSERAIGKRLAELKCVHMRAHAGGLASVWCRAVALRLRPRRSPALRWMIPTAAATNRWKTAARSLTRASGGMCIGWAGCVFGVPYYASTFRLHALRGRLCGANVVS